MLVVLLIHIHIHCKQMYSKLIRHIATDSFEERDMRKHSHARLILYKTCNIITPNIYFLRKYQTKWHIYRLVTISITIWKNIYLTEYLDQDILLIMPDYGLVLSLTLCSMLWGLFHLGGRGDWQLHGTPPPPPPCRDVLYEQHRGQGGQYADHQGGGETLGSEENIHFISGQ